MEKEFLPYNLALRMKTLGYKEKVLTYYENGVPKLYNDILGWDFNSSFLTCCSRPTFQSAFNWFRRKYNLNGEVKLHTGYMEDSFYKEIGLPYHFVILPKHIKDVSEITKSCYQYYTYEEAEIACLEKLIEIVEQKQLKNDLH
jgi:hypothetical protein